MNYKILFWHQNRPILLTETRKAIKEEQERMVNRWEMRQKGSGEDRGRTIFHTFNRQIPT
jgi:hypothetical protein